MNKILPTLALMLLALVGCASNQPTSNRPLIAPTVACDEHVVLEPHAAYPVAPAVESVAELAARSAPIADYARTLDAVTEYAYQQGQWAIGAAGVDERNRIKRATTASCLDALRARGFIL